jgi:hypothetical protein
VATDEGSPYAALFAKTMAVVEQDEARGGDPAEVARLVGRILDTRSPRLRYMVGPAFERFAARGKDFMPGRVFERIVLRIYGID